MGSRNNQLTVSMMMKMALIIVIKLCDDKCFIAAQIISEVISVSPSLIILR